jgi:hypothetical protein
MALSSCLEKRFPRGRPCLPYAVGGRAAGGFGHSRFSSCLKAWALELLEPDLVELVGPGFLPLGVFMRSVNPNKPSATLAICTPAGDRLGSPNCLSLRR